MENKNFYNDNNGELIKVNYNNSDRITTSARTLWEGLDKPYDQFTKWFDKYKEYGFVDGEDYRTVSTKILTTDIAAFGGTRATKITDYEITIEMAKELCMLQKSEAGRMYRKYFIECEKRMKELEKQLLLQTQQQLQLKESELQTVKDELWEIKSKPMIFRNYLKYLQGYGLKAGNKTLYRYMREKGNFNELNLPIEWLIDEGYFLVKKINGKREILITERGREALLKRLERSFGFELPKDAVEFKLAI